MPKQKRNKTEHKGVYYVDLANDLANDKKKNFELRHVYKEAAKLHLFNDLDSVKKFERFLIEAHKANNSNTHLKDGYIIS